MEKYKLFDAELKFMNIIWEEEPIKSGELVKVCNEKLGWKKSTTYTVLRKLAQRGVLKNEKDKSDEIIIGGAKFSSNFLFIYCIWNFR